MRNGFALTQSPSSRPQTGRFLLAAVRELTRSTRIKLNMRVSLHGHRKGIVIQHRTISPKSSGPALASPSVDHIPAGGFVLKFVSRDRVAKNMRAAKRRWTPSEQQLLEEMLGAKRSAAEIGLRLGRQEEAVYARVQRLRLKGLLPEGLSFSRVTN
jgi:hypothetical protein